MLRSRILLPFIFLTIGLTVLPTAALRAENPLERLHRKLFGNDEDKKEEERRKEEEKDRKKWEKEREKDRKRYEEEQRRREDEDRRYRDDRYDRRDDGRVGEEEHRKRQQQEWQYRRGPSAPGYGYTTRPIEADVQLGLRRSGHYGGPIDGTLGNSTRAAIREYQFDNRLPVTGKIDKKLLRSLGIE